MEHLLAAPKPIKIPGLDHPITIERNPNRVVVSAAGRVVADSLDALTLREASYEPVQYIPRKDVDMTLLARAGHTTYCPYKGDCAYYSIPAGGDRSVNAIWTYEAPYAAVAAIKDHLLIVIRSTRTTLKEARGTSQLHDWREISRNALNDAPTQSAAPTAAAQPKATRSDGPLATITEPMRAVATNPPVRATALFNPEAAPTWRSSTDIRTAVVNGATATPIPSAITTMAGRTPSQ
jgi:uncharacterized protein (DUF427 family)